MKLRPTPIFLAFAWICSARALPAQDAPDFATKILPLLEKRCIECHATEGRDANGRSRRTKGGLRLDSRDAIVRGGDSGPVLVAGRPEESELYKRTTLPADDDDVMPQKGDPLTAAETGLLREWIASGASFGTWTGTNAKVVDAPAKPDDAAPPARTGRESLRERVATGATPPGEAALAKATAAGARITDLSGDGRLLGISFEGSTDQIDARRLRELDVIAPNIGELDLSHTRIDDAGLDWVARCPRLMRLDLTEDAITVRGLARLQRADELRTLVLVGTKVDGSLATVLPRWPSLEAVYLWRSACDGDTLRELADSHPKIRFHGAPALPEPAPEASGEKRKRRR
ncbi:MAG: c-type cytochrome domain-containing protein [Planctomycetota bacterium]